MSSLNLVLMSINFFNIKYKEISISLQLIYSNGGLVINFGLLTFLLPIILPTPFLHFLTLLLPP